MIKNKLEIISIHIPKTGGTSLRNTFKKNYGEPSALRLDIKKDNIYLEEELFTHNELEDHIKVIHGHFSFKEIENRIENFDEIFKIVWLRNPVDRVLSNYFYLKNQLMLRFTENHDNIQMLTRMLRTIDEFIEIEENKNRMSKFISIDELKKMSFIGFADSYSEDLEKLSKLLNWTSYEEFLHNSTSKKLEVEQKIIDRIKILNKKDIELYEAAKELIKK